MENGGDRWQEFNSIEELKRHTLRIKENRKQEGKEIDLSTMTHIIRCLGGKMIKKGLISIDEVNNIIYFDWAWIYE